MRALLTHPRWLLLVAGVLTAVVLVLVARRAPHGIDHAATVVDVPRPVASTPDATAVLAPRVVAGDALTAIGPSLVTTPEAAYDVVFLTVAAAYGRCAPTHAHEFGAMAARARLPVLAGLTSVLGPHTGSRAALLAGIRELAARVPCNGPFDLSIGPFRQRVTIQAYAASFPDSYFEPDLTTAPAAFAGRTLAERASDSCNGVAYAVLPLDAPRAWQCTSLRAEARQRISALCGGSADAAAQQIHDVVTRLPSTCQ